MIREAIEAQARTGAPDDVALESLRNDIAQMIDSITKAIERAREFSLRGLVSEAASVVEDFPDLARQADALAAFPRSSPTVSRFWAQYIDGAADPILLPSTEDVDMLAGFVDHATRLRPLLDALRLAALRREPLTNRLTILKKLRETDQRNRMWLDQIDALEKEWVKRISEMRGDAAASRDDLEEAFTALSTREWVAPVPRGLKDEIYAQLKPLRASVAGERYDEIAAKIHDAAALMDRNELEQLEAAWALVYHETGRMPDQSLQDAVAPAFEWMARIAADEAAQSEFDGLVDQLERALNAGSSAVDIERRLATLRDNGRSVPDGVRARAQGWIDAQRERARRRHRIILVASIAAAAVTLTAGGLAINAFTRAKERDDAIAALTALVEKGDSPAARALGAEIRARPELSSPDKLTPELSAVLVRESALAAEWDAQRLALLSEFAEIQRALDDHPSRVRLKAISDQLQQMRARARLAQESAAIEKLASLHADRAIERDGADAKVGDEAFASCDALLREWPLPDRWTPAQQCDLARWEAYIAVLDRVKGALQRAGLDVAGSDVQESRLKLKGEGADARIAEAQSRRSELADALAALTPSKVGARVSVESQLPERLKTILASHGATLARLGKLGAFESSQACAPAWSSIEAWREKVQPKVADAFGPRADANTNANALQALQGFLASFPETPYQSRVAELIRRIDPAALQPIWARDRVRSALVDFFYSDIEEVPIAGGDRFFYRRSSDVDRDPLHRAIENLADLAMKPDRLNAMLLKPGERIVGTTRKSEISSAWRQLETTLGTPSVDAGEVQGLMLDLLERLRTMPSSDVLWRARALRDLATVLRQSGQVPTAASEPLNAWFTRCDRQWQEALSVDWLRATYDAPVNARVLRGSAAAAIADFPQLSQLAKAAEAERLRAKEEIRTLAPIGVLMPIVLDETSRALGESYADGPVVLVGRVSNQWKFIETMLKQNRIDANIPGIPEGPILVFKRNGS
jgi:hypothetical protein